MKKLWYQKPAQAWEEVLPLGNGSLGAMIWGEPLQETIGLNHERLWSGCYIDHNPKEAAKWLPQVRELIFARRYSEAERMMEAHFLGEYNESYMPAGNLKMVLPEGAVSEYQRELVLDTAEAEVSFLLDGAKVSRKAFVSYPQKAMILRIDSEKPLTEVRFWYESRMIYRASEETAGGVLYHMQCPEHVDPNYLGKGEDGIIWGDKGMKFPLEVRVLETDGEQSVEATAGEAAVAGWELVVRGARVITLALTILDPWQYDLEDYQAYEAEHLADYQALYNRVELEMPGKEGLTTDEWLMAPDPGLYALYYQYSRYLLISSARQGSLPPNLQGIWAWQLLPPWSSNWTTNINAEMNYWPALTANLAECVEPYVDMVRRICEEGKKTAAAFGCKGSCVGHNSDGWGHTNPVGIARGEDRGEEGCLEWAFWLMAEVWMDQEVWRQYWYHPNEAYLESTVYPLLRESVLFCLDWLVEYEGKYVTCPATTPENRFVHEGEKISVSLATTMDMTLIRELFRNFKRASDILGRTELMDRIEAVEDKLYGPVLNTDGSVCEWYEEKVEVEPGHRHLSHLYGLFPSDLWRDDETMREACRKSLDNRMSAGGGHTGWSLAWVLNLYTMLKDTDKVEQYLKQMMQRSSYPNLWSKHPPYQIDGNFGVAAAIGHMLVAEKEGEIEYFPCIPASWTEGSVKGLCVPGGREVSFRWKDGTVMDVQVTERG